MPKVKQNPKLDLIAQLDCPHCNNKIDIIKVTNVIKPAESATKEVTYKVEKSLQAPLSSFSTEKK